METLQATTQHGGEIPAEYVASPNGQNPNGHNPTEPHGEAHRHGHDRGTGEEIPADLKAPSKAALIGVVIAVAILFVALFVVGWLPARHRAGEAQADANERLSAKPIVATTQPTIPQSEKDLVLPCDVKANQDTLLYSRATGFLKKWNVDINDRVKAGDLLAEIDIPDVAAQLQASKAALEQSRAAVETAKSNKDLAEKTLARYLEADKNQPGSITKEDLDTRISSRDQAVAALKQAEANVGAAVADVQRYETLLGFEKIYAPFSGVVTYRGFDNGALINATDQTANHELFRIQQTDPLRVFVSVPQAYSTQISIGQDAQLNVRNYVEPFNGTVVRSSASLDENTRTMQFQIDFPNPDNKLYPGMYGEIHLPVHTVKHNLTIPASALVFNTNGSQVIVVKDGRAHFQKIVVGRDFGTELEVSAGLTADDMVDVNPDETIVEGGEVEVHDNNKDKPAGPPEAPKPEKVASKD